MCSLLRSPHAGMTSVRSTSTWLSYAGHKWKTNASWTKSPNNSGHRPAPSRPDMHRHAGAVTFCGQQPLARCRADANVAVILAHPEQGVPHVVIQAIGMPGRSTSLHTTEHRTEYDSRHGLHNLQGSFFAVALPLDAGH